MKKFVFQSFLLLILIAGGMWFFGSSQKGNVNLPFLPPRSTLSQLQINDKILTVEIADTSSKRNKGLGGRSSLGENEGMLFIFQKPDKYPFWMKGLTFPLDFVWIRGDKVVDLLENVQPPASGQADSSLSIYSSKEEMDKVLEVLAGTIQKLNIKVGDTIKLTQP